MIFSSSQDGGRLSKLENFRECWLVLLDLGGAGTLRGTPPWLVVLTYTKRVLSYKFVRKL